MQEGSVVGPWTSPPQVCARRLVCSFVAGVVVEVERHVEGVLGGLVDDFEVELVEQGA
jgi:hypothetical protein